MFQFPEKILRVFREEQHQESFEKNGYIILPFYTPEEIKVLEDVYHRLHPVDEKGFFPSTFSQNKNYRHQADTEIRRVGKRSVDKYCIDIKEVFGAFIVKSPGADSGMCVHQDMSLVDESRFTGINIWVPLVDLTIENGAIFVLPKSHRLFPTYRGSSIPEFFSPVMNDIIDYLQPVLVKAGEAVFFDQSIIHFSPPNYSNNVRIVTNTYITHQTAEYRTFYWNKNVHGNKHLEAFAQDNDFMTNFEQFGENIRDRPKVGKSLGLLEYNFPSIDKAYLEKNFLKTNARQLIENALPKANNSFVLNETLSTQPKTLFQKFKNLFEKV